MVNGEKSCLTKGSITSKTDGTNIINNYYNKCSVRANLEVKELTATEITR